MRRALGTVLVVLLLLTPLVAVGESIQDQIVASGQAAVKEAITRVAPAVVRIDATKRVSTWWDELLQDPFLRRFFGEPPDDPDRLATSVGSGFIVELDGRKYVVTNAHIVEGAESVRITAQDGRTLPAELIGKDSWLDLAVLALQGDRELPMVPVGESTTLEVGDWVIAIGNPLGLDYTVTMGIVSALNRSVPRPDGTGYFRRMIQTDAAINPGNSGGPLVNAYGEVVGMNTLIARRTGTGITVEGINFAVPMTEISRALPRLVAEGTVARAWLGVYIQELSPNAERQFGVPPRQGVLVSDTVAGGPAREAGLMPGDVIVSIDGMPVGTVDELQSEIMYREVDETVEVGVVRDREPMTIDVVLARRPDETALVKSTPEPGVEHQEGLRAFGITVRAVTSELMDRYNLDRSAGVVAVTVEPGSRAYWSGVREGDLILEVNRRSVTSVDDWDEIVEDLGESSDVVLTVLRAGHRQFIFMP